MSKRLKYERPLLVDLAGRGQNAEGRCKNGSAQITGSCGGGGNAQGNCGGGTLPQNGCGTGPSAWQGCGNGESAAVQCFDGASTFLGTCTQGGSVWW